MWFLIKAAFWFSLVLVLLPIFGPEDASQPQPVAGASVDIGETVSAATQAIGYFSAICAEKPDVCVKGAETFNALGHRAKDGAKIAYQLLETQFGDEAAKPVALVKAGDETKPGDAVTTGTVPASIAAAQPLPPAQKVDATLVSAAAGGSEAAVDRAPANLELGVSRIPVPEKRIAPHRPS